MHVRQQLSMLQSILKSHWTCGDLLRGTVAPNVSVDCDLLAKCNYHKQAVFAITPGTRLKYQVS